MQKCILFEEKFTISKVVGSIVNILPFFFCVELSCAVWGEGGGGGPGGRIVMDAEEI